MTLSVSTSVLFEMSNRKVDLIRKISKLLISKAEGDEEEVVYEDRPYQQAIIQTCIEKNSIVFLPTGSGKTFIAIQVLKHFSHEIEK